MKKRIFSLFLVFALCLSLLPGAVWAEDTPVAEPAETNEETTEPEVYEETGGEDEVVEEEVAYVAQIGDKTYATLQEAINAAKTGETVEMLQNVDLGSSAAKFYTSTNKAKNVIVDLGGYTLTSAASATVTVAATGWIIQNGTIKNTYPTTVATGGAVNVVNSSTLTLRGGANGLKIESASSGLTIRINNGEANVVIEDGVQISGEYGAYLYGSPYKYNGKYTGKTALTVDGGDISGTVAGIAVWGPYKANTSASATLTVNGGSISSTTGYGIAGNGSADYLGDTININGGTITSAKDTAIYHPQAGVLNVTGGEITGVTGGIQMCAGTLNVSGGTITATGSGVTDGKTGDGSIPDGAAVSIVDRGYPAGTPTADITGGTMKSAASVMPVQAYGWASNTKTEWTNETGFITGGTFSADVSKYAPAGVNLTKNEDGTYGATDTREAAIGDVKYALLQEAINAAKTGDTVTLLQDVTGQVVVQEAQNITLDLNGHKITNSGSALLNYGTLVIKDTMKTGAIISTGFVGIGPQNNSTTTIKYANVESVEGAVLWGDSVGATVTIEDGVFSASDNAVLAGNGTKRTGDHNTITINGGVFNGTIQSSGYIACGIYAPWKDVVTVNGGTFNIENGIGILARAGQVKVNGGTFLCTGTDKGGIGDKKVLLTAGQALYFDASNPDYPAYDPETDDMQVTGGTFSSDVSDYLAEGYDLIGGTDGYTVATKAEVEAEAVAKIGDKSYSSLAAALACAEDGNTVTLVQDAHVSGDDTKEARTIVTSKITLELNGHTIFSPNNMGDNETNFVALVIDADTTINDSKGGGGIDTGKNGGYALNVRNGATLTINSGRYYGGGTAVQVQKGTLVINDGEFACEPYSNPVYGYKFLINCIDAAWKDGSAKMDIRGGSFENFDPSDSASENPRGNFLNENYGAYTDSVSAGTEKVWRVGVKQDVSYEEITGKDETEQTVIDTALKSIKDNTAANNFAGHGADDEAVKTAGEEALKKAGATIDDDTTIITTISVKTTAMEVNGAAVTAVTFDVKPIAKVTVGETTYEAPISNAELNGQSLTFRLPIPFANAAAGNVVKVTHFKEDGTTETFRLPVLEANGDLYVELSSKTFSAWSVELGDKSDAVAKTTTQYFDTVKEAFDAAKDGDTVTLLDDADITGWILIRNKKVTLDLNGKILRGSADYPWIFVWEDGELVVDGTKGDSVVNNVSFAVGQNTNSNGTLTLNGGTYTVDDMTVIHVNGTCQNSDVTIRNATLLSKESNGVQFNGSGNFLVDNSSITGYTAIYQKGGKLTIKDSTITATGELIDAQFNSNGSDPTGDAIVLDTAKGYIGNIELNIEGSTTVNGGNGAAIREVLTKGDDSTTKAIRIGTGTTLTSSAVLPIITSDEFNIRTDSELTIESGAEVKQGSESKNSIYTNTTPKFKSFKLMIDGAKYEAAKQENGVYVYEIANSGTISNNNVQAVFDVDYGTVQYKIGDGDWTTIKSGDRIAGFAPDTLITFRLVYPVGQVQQEVLYELKAKMTGEASTPYTFTAKPVGGVVGNTVTFEVYVSSTDEAPLGSFNFELTYGGALTSPAFAEASGFNGIVVSNDTVNKKLSAGFAIGTESANKDGVDVSKETRICTLTFTLVDGYATDKNGHFELAFTGKPVATPKGYDKNNGTITASVDLGSYTVTVPEGVTVMGWKASNDDQTYNDGDEVQFGTNLTATAETDADEQEVIRQGGFQYTIGDEAAQNPTVTANDKFDSFEISIPGSDIVGDVTITAPEKVKYVIIKFVGGNGADLDGSDTGYATQGQGDALYDSLANYVAVGTNYMSPPTQTAKDGYRLDTAVDGKTQQWTYKANGTAETDSIVSSAQMTPTCDYRGEDFKCKEMTLTAMVVKTWTVTYVAGANGSKIVAKDDGVDGEALDTITVDAGEPVSDLKDVKPVPKVGYTFDSWTVTADGSEYTDETVTTNITITANFKAQTYNVFYDDDVASITYEGGVTANKVTHAEDGNVVFTLEAKRNKVITGVYYSVAATPETGSAVIEREPLTADADGKYNIPLSAVTGDLTITVVGKDQYTVTIIPGAYGTTPNGNTIKVTAGEKLAKTDVDKMVEALPGYKLKGWYTDANYETEANFGTDGLEITGNTRLYAKFVDATYKFTGNGVDVKSGLNGTDGKTGDATHGTDITFEVPYNESEGIVSKVSYTVDDTDKGELTPDANGKYTIPGSSITGDVVVKKKTLATEAGLTGPMTISFIKRDGNATDVEAEKIPYMAIVAQNSGMKIMLLKSSDFEADGYNGSKYFELTNGTQMFWSEKYDAYVCWVNEAETKTTMAGKIKLGSGTTYAIKYDGDLNFDNEVNSADAGIVNDALLNARVVPTSALQLFEMDVTGNQTISADDVTWILKKTVGLNPNETTGN